MSRIKSDDGRDPRLPAVSEGSADGSDGRGRDAVFRSNVHPLSASTRVQFRADLFLKRWAAKQEQELLRQKEEEEIQNRLEALRLKVCCYLL